MDISGHILAALLKILFIIAVVVGAFAPMLVWAERRQSAMIQDRVGPRRAHIPLPRGVVGLFRASLKPMEAGGFLSFFAAGLAILTLVLMGLFGIETVAGQDAETFYLAVIGFGIAGVLLRLGHKLHKGIVDSGGKLALLGLLHPAADAVKMIFKEDFTPPKADKFLFSIAPIITVIPAIISFAVIPFADTLYLEYWDQVVPRDGEIIATAVPMQVASLNVGILFIFAAAGTGVIGAAVGGYASDNKFSLMGGIRAASQMVSYEVALGLTIVPCFMIYDSLRLEDMAAWQHEHGWWGFFIPPLTIASILYLFAAIAETKRIPFDVPEGESELVGGYLTEYSGMKFGMFFTGEFIEVVVLAALAVVLFFGGWDVPFLYRSGFDLPGTWELTVPMTEWVITDQFLLQHWAVLLIQVLFFLFKVVVLMWLQLMIRWTLPRFRYDQLMQLCWKGLLPLSLINILVTGILVLLWT